MSTHYVVWCEDCEVFGPTIRDAAGGIVFAVLAQGTDSGQLDIDEVAKAAWREFLGEHEFHPLRLAREGSVPQVAHVAQPVAYADGISATVTARCGDCAWNGTAYGVEGDLQRAYEAAAREASAHMNAPESTVTERPAPTL